MNTAEKIIEKFGGLTPLARMIEKRPSTVAYWAKSGTIPSKWHSTLLNLAQEQGLSLAAQDLIPMTEPGSVAIFQKSSPDPNQEDNAPNRIPLAKWLGVLSIGELD